MAASDPLRDAEIKRIFQGVAFTPATTLWVHLYTANPVSSGAGTEVSTAGGSLYAAIGVTTAGWTTNGVGSVINNAVLSFTTAAGTAWGTITGAAISDSSVHAAGSTNYVWGALTANKTISSGDGVQFSSGALQIAFTS